jgi:hypothetical protein
VAGDALHGTGVFGDGDTGVRGEGRSATGYGISAHNSGGGLAGFFQGNVSVQGNICANNVSCASDARLKQGITTLNYGLPQVLRLRPVSWHWKAQPEGTLQLGLVAQEVEPVLPELILHGVDAKDSLGLNYMGLIPVLVKGIQEQQQQITRQQAAVKKQQDQIAALRTANAALNGRLRLIERTLKNKRGSTRQRL